MTTSAAMTSFTRSNFTFTVSELIDQPIMYLIFGVRVKIHNDKPELPASQLYFYSDPKYHVMLAGQEGIEPPTCGFGDRRSAN